MKCAMTPGKAEDNLELPYSVEILRGTTGDGVSLIAFLNAALAHAVGRSESPTTTADRAAARLPVNGQD